MRSIFIALSAISLAACSSTQVTKDEVFDASSDSGVVVVGLLSSEPFRVQLIKLDASKTRPALNRFGREKIIPYDGTASWEYKLAKLRPGSYVINLAEIGKPVRMRVCNQETIAFDVLPGRIVYLGDLTVSSYSPNPPTVQEVFDGKPAEQFRWSKGDINQAKKFVAENSEIQGEVELTELSLVKRSRCWN